MLASPKRSFKVLTSAQERRDVLEPRQTIQAGPGLRARPGKKGVYADGKALPAPQALGPHGALARLGLPVSLEPVASAAPHTQGP